MDPNLYAQLSTYDEHKQFLSETFHTINSINMEELELVAQQFSNSKKICEDRLNKIQAGLDKILQTGTAAPQSSIQPAAEQPPSDPYGELDGDIEF